MLESGREQLRVAMIGDYPRDTDNIGGGVESVMSYLCRELARDASISLTVVTLDRWNLGQRVEHFDGYTVHYLAQSGVRGPARRYLNIRRLAKCIESLEPDIVHAQIAGQYSEAAHRTTFPYVLTLHGVRYLEAQLRMGWVDRLYRNRVVASEERRSIQNASYIISINPFIDDCFRQLLRGHVSHIENPIASTWFDVVGEGNSHGILYAGRITPRKDIMTLLRGFKYFAERFPDATLRIAGAPDNPDPAGYFDRLKQYVSEAGMTDSVEFLGNLSEQELLAEYAANGTFVIASVLETAPMSIAQAQAAGRLVVATDAGGCRHMITDGKTGRIVPIGSAEALGRALIECAEDPDYSRTMRTETRSAAGNRYRAETIAEKTIALYRKILEEAAENE